MHFPLDAIYSYGAQGDSFDGHVSSYVRAGAINEENRADRVLRPAGC